MTATKNCGRCCNPEPCATGYGMQFKNKLLSELYPEPEVHFTVQPRSPVYFHPTTWTDDMLQADCCDENDTCYAMCSSCNQHVNVDGDVYPVPITGTYFDGECVCGSPAPAECPDTAEAKSSTWSGNLTPTGHYTWIEVPLCVDCITSPPIGCSSPCSHSAFSGYHIRSLADYSHTYNAGGYTHAVYIELVHAYGRHLVAGAPEPHDCSWLELRVAVDWPLIGNPDLLQPVPPNPYALGATYYYRNAYAGEATADDWLWKPFWLHTVHAGARGSAHVDCTSATFSGLERREPGSVGGCHPITGCYGGVEPTDYTQSITVAPLLWCASAWSGVLSLSALPPILPWINPYHSFKLTR